LNGLFNDNDYWNQQRFINLIDTIKKDKILTTWFDDANSVMNERTISSKDTDADGNTIIVHNRPDRIVKTPDGDILVIDYKFGQKKDTETVSNHSSKVRKYMDLLTMIGEDKKHMKGYLWYARYNTIVTVEPD
jgi:RecB family exonuclease